MRGQILGIEDGAGLLLGPQDERRVFPLSEWRSGGQPAAGQWVDFVADGEGARSVYLIPGQAPAAYTASHTSSSFVLGAIGVACLAAGLVIPVVPTLAAFIFGIIGAGRAIDERDNTGLTLSRISWIGALVLMGLGILALIVLLVFFGSLLSFWMNWSDFAPPVRT